MTLKNILNHNNINYDNIATIRVNNKVGANFNYNTTFDIEMNKMQKNRFRSNCKMYITVRLR
jgi:hypothetical protein